MTVLYTCILFGVGAREIVRAGQSRLLLAQLRSQAREHPITGLGNALALREDLDVRAARQASAALFLLDLGRVKDISGRRGSRAGEEVLTAVAQALCEFADDNDHVSVFQLSGDDFAVVADANDIALDQGVLALRQAVRQATEKLVSTAHSALVPSIGIAVMGGPRVPRPRLGEETASSAASPSGAGDVLGHAAHALAVARHEAGGTCVYSAELTCKEERRAQIESGLRKALRYGGVQAHFQPIIEMTSGKVIGLEALARWHDHELGNVSPGEFIPVAEEVGLIPDIGLVVLEQAVEMSGRLRAEGKPVYVSVNVSPLQLVQDGFVQAVSDSLARHRVDPYYVVIEVTEGIFVDQESRAVRMLGELSQLGVRIALDDFGSGYSSLGYMSRLPLQVVKIDRSLVSRVLQTRPMAVVAGILDLCAALHLSVVVEGVETQAESDQLVALGAVQGQGWLWSPATSADKLPGLLDERGVREMGGQVLGPRAIEV